ncbi:hypothetical protein BWR19_07865 [Halomonas sp. 1513]|nr:hypothetical protein BWR19_07865 [Halomonas sp. 1513]
MVVAGLAGCTTVTTSMPGNVFALEGNGDNEWVTGRCGERYAADIGVQLDMIRQLLESDRPRSALAHLDSHDFGIGEADLLRGDALRAIERHGEADAVYDSLTSSCLAADAYRGMARNAASRGDRREALVLMQQARQERPADPRIRNDLGYLLMLEGQRGAAREEFLTAIELDSGQRNAASNLVLLLMQEGQTAQAENMAARLGVDAALVERLRRASPTGADS